MKLNWNVRKFSLNLNSWWIWKWDRSCSKTWLDKFWLTTNAESHKNIWRKLVSFEVQTQAFKMFIWQSYNRMYTITQSISIWVGCTHHWFPIVLVFAQIFDTCLLPCVFEFFEDLTVVDLVCISQRWDVHENRAISKNKKTFKKLIAFKTYWVGHPLKSVWSVVLWVLAFSMSSGKLDSQGKLAVVISTSR